MSILKIETIQKNYYVYIENSFDNLLSAFEKEDLTGKKLLCVFDSNTEKLFAETMEALLAPKSGGFFKHIIPAGEESKSIEELTGIYEELIRLNFNRDSVIIAAGGGVVGDLAGFAASTFMRGIRFVQIPTTLLSQVDSGVGGKTAINFSNAKNMIGTFYQPELVYINTASLKTLEKKEFLSGMCEIIKYAYITDKFPYKYLKNNKDKIMALENEAISYIIEKAIEAKANIVKDDERDEGIRNILNFGHTFGHAVESVCDFRIPHGICVGIGMRAALALSRKENEDFNSEYEKSIDLLDLYGVPVNISAHSAKELYEASLKDKKIKENKLNLVLISKMGTAYRTKNIDKKDILWAYEQIVK